MSKPPIRTKIESEDFEGFVNEVAIRLWNGLLPIKRFRNLELRDFAELLETLDKSLKPYRQ